MHGNSSGYLYVMHKETCTKSMLVFHRPQTSCNTCTQSLTVELHAVSPYSCHDMQQAEDMSNSRYAMRHVENMSNCCCYMQHLDDQSCCCCHDMQHPEVTSNSSNDMQHTEDVRVTAAMPCSMLRMQAAMKCCTCWHVLLFRWLVWGILICVWDPPDTPAWKWSLLFLNPAWTQRTVSKKRWIWPHHFCGTA